MIDIVSVNDGLDLGLYNTEVGRAGNILSIQVGSLEYAPNVGIDLAYFLDEDIQFQNESFRSYLIQVLANFGINVSNINESIETLFNDMKIEISSSDQTGTALVAR